MFEGPFKESIVKRAQNKKLVEINIHNLRDFADDKRGTVDDRPYGGGVGMVMMVEPVYEALSELLKCEMGNVKLDVEVRSEKQKSHLPHHNLASHLQHPNSTRIVLLSPRGKVFNQKTAQEFSGLDHLILICGHYEGVDERVTEHLIDEEISLGDFVLTGGEIPAMAITDAVTRLIPGVLEKPEATRNESFSSSQLPVTNYQLLEHPQYTRPEEFKGWKVPEILLSGDHKKIETWRQEKALEKTKKVRPDLLEH